MERLRLSEEIFSRLDLAPLFSLLKRGQKFLNQDLELRNSKGEVVLSCPKSQIPMLSDQEYCDLLQRELSQGRIQQISLDQSHLLTAVPILKDDYLMGALLGCGRQDTGAGSRAGGDSLRLAKYKQAKDLDLKIYQHLADMIAKECLTQLEIMSLSEELASRYEELNLFYDVGQWLRGVQESDESIQLIIDKISDTLEVDHSFISLPSKNILTMSGCFESWENNGGARSHLERLGNDLLSSLVNDDFIICDQINSRGLLKAHFPYPAEVSLIAVPVNMSSLRQGVLGAFFLHDEPRGKKFTASDVRLLQSMAEVISILLSNTELYHNLKTFLVNVVKCLVSAIEAKDMYTRGHSERVNHISMLIAEHMNLPPAVKESLNWASILHDIGKIGIPEKILTKPGKLTDEEYAEIKKHPERGYVILKPIQGFQSSLDGVRFHQERYDGHGYPQGLKGKDIPLSARIIAVGDTYDAITSDRAYRQGRSHQEAVAEIKRVAGTQLDPDIVRVFLEVAESHKEELLKLERQTEGGGVG